MRFPVLSKNKIPEKRNGFESLRFLISNCTMLRLPPSLVCQTCEWEPHMSKPRPSTEILARSRLSDSNAVVSQLCILKRVIRKTAQGLGERGAPNPVPTVSFSLGLFFNRPFPRVPPGLCFKARVGAQPLIWKSFFILMQIKLIFRRKVVHLASFWKWGFLELGNGLFLRRPYGLKSRHRLLRPSLLSLSWIYQDLLSLWAHYPNLANKLDPQMPKKYYKNARQIPKRKCSRISKAELLIKCPRAENKITSGTVVKVSL